MTPSGIWTFVRNGVAVGKTSAAFRAVRLPPTTDLPALIRWANQLMVSIEDIARRARALPFGGPGTVSLAVAFTNGASVTIPHYLGDAAGDGSNVVALIGPARTLSAGAALATFTSASASTVTFAALGTFTADVFLMVSPH